MRKAIVDCDWLNQHLQDPNVRVVDTRFVLGEPKEGLLKYIEAHIPGALFFDLEKDLSGPAEKHGGRHPLPEINLFAEKLSAAGIDETITVVAYDEDGGMFSARFWWMLQYLGHEKVFILDGGFNEWNRKGYPTNTDFPVVEKKTFTPNIQSDLVVDIEEVKKRPASTVLIDARSPERYAGLEEPIDKKAGHIPGAVNAFWKQNYNEKGTWKTKDELSNFYRGFGEGEEQIVYCGSGVSACPNIIGLAEAGFENVKLYLGSWSDWSSYEDNPVETGK
ncbi:sulfurtransferase [Bacillus tianshenii]|nr:sulfurtransferase [Bacillus tianshenii]